MFKHEDVLAVMYLRVLNTKWYQFRKRKNLYKKAEDYKNLHKTEFLSGKTVKLRDCCYKCNSAITHRNCRLPSGCDTCNSTAT